MIEKIKEDTYHFQKNIYEHEWENHKFPHNDKHFLNFFLSNIFLMLKLLLINDNEVFV